MKGSVGGELMNGILSVGCGLLVLIASAAFGQEVTDDEWYVFKGADGRVHKRCVSHCSSWMTRTGRRRMRPAN